MANLDESATWEPFIKMLAVTDPALGGPGGALNVPLAQIANRLKYLWTLWHSPPRDITAGAGAIVATDVLVHVNYDGPVVIDLPSAAEMADYGTKGIPVKDVSGAASEDNAITFQAGAGTTLEYNHVIKLPLGALTWYLDGTVWRAR